MQEFLQAIGAGATDSGDILCAGEPADLRALADATVISPLGHYGILAVDGPDSAKFLQGQTTCDVAAVTDSQSLPGACCSIKGRMLTSFQLARRDDRHYWLRMRGDLVAATARNLGKYSVFSKIELAAAENIVALGLHGPDAAAVAATLGALPAGRHGTAAAGGGLLLQLDDNAQWFECWLPQPAALALWQQCHGRLAAAGTRYWQWLTIRAGLGEVSAATADQFIPQMLNYHLTGAISFKKGCYTGQEIVARTHYRGQIKRHMHRAGTAAPAPAPGAEIDGAGGQKVGTVVNSVSIDGQSAELLAVFGDGAVAQDNAQFSVNGAALHLLDLPYAIT
jgi:folate-binding protein YgfZ